MLSLLQSVSNLEKFSQIAIQFNLMQFGDYDACNFDTLTLLALAVVYFVVVKVRSHDPFLRIRFLLVPKNGSFEHIKNDLPSNGSVI